MKGENALLLAHLSVGMSETKTKCAHIFKGISLSCRYSCLLHSFSSICLIEFFEPCLVVASSMVRVNFPNLYNLFFHSLAILLMKFQIIIKGCTFCARRKKIVFGLIIDMQNESQSSSHWGLESSSKTGIQSIVQKMCTKSFFSNIHTILCTKSICFSFFQQLTFKSQSNDGIDIRMQWKEYHY